jgi:L-ascorbate metabolism protein UlaG (beta-lactamase superfamily)
MTRAILEYDQLVLKEQKMSERKCYLRPNVILEPLVGQWYAWPHLIPPHTAAMNIANAHMKMMKSYVSAPDFHAAAIRNPAMRGGPFVDFPSSRVNEVRALMDRTARDQRAMLDLADAIKKLNDLLSAEARGQSLEPLYEKVPDALKGYVELTYDVNSNPSVRFIEGLLYGSRFYDASRQGVDLSLKETDERPFVFSTPRLGGDGHVQTNLPFFHEATDKLLEARAVPQCPNALAEMLGLDKEDFGVFGQMMTEEPPRPAENYRGDSVRIRYFGHACILIETRDVSLMTDPCLAYSHTSDVPRYTFEDLPERIDYILITHTHQDHVLFETLLQLRHRVGQVIVPRCGGGGLEDPSLKLILQHIGFKRVVEIDDMETIEIEGGGSVTGIPFLGEHGDLNIRSKEAHLISVCGRSILCAADSANLESRLYQHVHEMVGDVDVLFLGMECDGAPLTWIYGPLLTRPLDRRMDQSRRLSGSDYSRGIDIVKRFNCRSTFVYAMGQEPWLGYLTSIKYTDESKPIVESNKLIETCSGMGVYAERLFGAKEIMV